MNSFSVRPGTPAERLFWQIQKNWHRLSYIETYPEEVLSLSDLDEWEDDSDPIAEEIELLEDEIRRFTRYLQAIS